MFAITENLATVRFEYSYGHINNDRNAGQPGEQAKQREDSAKEFCKYAKRQPDLCAQSKETDKMSLVLIKVHQFIIAMRYQQGG